MYIVFFFRNKNMGYYVSVILEIDFQSRKFEGVIIVYSKFFITS